MRAQGKSHVWQLERSAFQQTARELANEHTDSLAAWLQSTFPFFGDAKLKALRPLALSLKKLQVAPCSTVMQSLNRLHSLLVMRRYACYSSRSLRRSCSGGCGGSEAGWGCSS